MYEVIQTNAFKKDYKLAKKRGRNTDLLKEIVKILANGEPISEKNYDHYLIGNYKGCRECHIQPDWLLIYEIDGRILYLHRTGTHSDLFG